MIGMLAAAIITASVSQASPALDALGLSALHWNETAAEIAQTPLTLIADVSRDRAALSLTPGRQVEVTLGACAFSARLFGAHDKLTRVELTLTSGDRSSCAQAMVSRLVAALGPPRPQGAFRSMSGDSQGHITGYAKQEPFWDGAGETASLIEWGPPMKSLGLAATADGDEVATVR